MLDLFSFSNWLDWAIALAFGLFAIYQGLRVRRSASRNLEQFFLAGRSLTGFRAGISMAATQFAADTPLLVIGLIAAGGIYSLWRLWIYAIAFLLMGYLLGSAWRRAGVLTDAELTRLRYSGPAVSFLRVVKALYYGLVMNCFVMALVFTAALRIFEAFLPWHQLLPELIYGLFQKIVSFIGIELVSHSSSLPASIAATDNFISILVILTFVALYSGSGGLRAVVATDRLQFTLMILATLLYALLLLSAAGGLTALPQNLVEIYGYQKARSILSFFPMEEATPFLAIIAIQWLFQRNSDGSGYLAQRIMACRSQKDASQAALIFTYLQILLRSCLWIPIALSLLVIYPLAPDASLDETLLSQRETLFIDGINSYLPTGLRGLMFAAMLAALASTIDTHFNWGASYLCNDIYLPLRRHFRKGRHFPKKRVGNGRADDRRADDGRVDDGRAGDSKADDKRAVLVARLCGLLTLFLSLSLLSVISSIQTAWHISLLFGAGSGLVLLLRWLWERINIYCELAAMLVSLLLSPILLFFIEEEWLRISWMALLSTIAVIATAYLSPATEKLHLLAFYKRVNPAGFWSRTAALAGQDPSWPLRRFLLAVAQCLLSAVLLFLLLYGIVRFLFPLESSDYMAAGISYLCCLPLAILSYYLRRIKDKKFQDIQ